MSATTDIYGLIGFPLEHSMSRMFFNQKFEAEGINARYLNFELPDIGDLHELIAEYPELRGLNVTIPYKEQVIPYLDSIDPYAESIGAVNVIRVTQTENSLKLCGYNSDVIGFRESIRPLLRPYHRRALILGTGGASKAVEAALNELGIPAIKVSRTPSDTQMSYADLSPEVMARHTVIINTTPLGMYPDVDSCPDIPYDLLTGRHLCYDLLYNPDRTKFMKLAEAHGATVKNGLEMLLLQAFESWRIWTTAD